MPSPIAHSGVALALWPMLREDHRHPGAPRNRRILAGMLVFMVCGADVDFIPHVVLDPPSIFRHGGATHSLLTGMVAATLFAVGSRALVSASWLRLWIVGCLAWWVHILLDFFTPGGGVMVLWPITDERFVSPISLFWGAQHSQPFAFHQHVITLLTEIPFVLLMWWIGHRIQSRPTPAVS